jgi:hypothetical protein
VAKPPAAGKGRPLGARNKRTVEFMAVLEARGFCPATALIDCYVEAKKTYDNYGTIYDAICDARIAKNDKDGSFAAPATDEGHKYLKIAADIAKDLAGYAYPKLKAIEQTKSNSLEGMTTEQRLEAMRQAVKFLEAQVKQDESKPS